MDEKTKKAIVSRTAQQAVIPTSADQLQKSTGLPFYRSTELYQTPLAQAFQNNDGILLLLVKDNPNYGHWTLLLHHPEEKTIEFFDSFGNEIPDKLKEYLVRELPIGYNVIYSKKSLQQKTKSSQTCGRWVVLRYATKQTPLGKFVTQMANKIPQQYRDLVVSQITQ